MVNEIVEKIIRVASYSDKVIPAVDTMYFLLFVALVAGQAVDNDTRQAVDTLFANNTRSLDPFMDLEEVTKAPGESIGALERCGEGSDAGVHACVAYYMCDGRTKTIVQTGVTDGFGLIDIR